MDLSAINAKSEDPNRDDELDHPPVDERLKALSASLKEKVFGQSEAINKILSGMLPKDNGKRPSMLLMGPAGVGKTESVKKIAEMMFNTKNDGGIIEIPMDGSAGDISDIFARISGKPSRAQIAEAAAQECHTGTTQAITPLKQIRLKTGFAYC